MKETRTTSEVARELRDEGMNIKVAVPFAKALTEEAKGESAEAERYLDKAIAAEEALGA